jgi:hypothetical protein
MWEIHEPWVHKALRACFARGAVRSAADPLWMMGDPTAVGEPAACGPAARGDP